MIGKAAALVVGLTSHTIAEPIAVKVVDAAGEQVYVEPGEAAGLRVGTRVTIGPQTLVVAELNATGAALRLPRGGVPAIAIGATGTATPTAPRPPRDASTTLEQWPAATPPARAQQPRTIPLGRERAGASVTVLATGFGATGKASRASAEARVIASFEQRSGLGGRPLGADLDVAARAYSTGWDRDEHVPLLVRAAQLSWGRDLAVGRLRHAATSIGMLDGARAGAQIGSVGLAAFGGLVPDPLGGKPGADASRFGAELVWDEPGLAWQPRLAVAAVGSTWEGELDERRVMLAGSIGRERVWIDGLVEAQAFADDNPFAASAVELTTANASVAWRAPGGHAGASVAYLRPERTLRLAAALPPGWLCVGDASDACIGGDRWVTASASAGLARRGWALDAVATLGHTRAFAPDDSALRSALDVSGYLRGELRRAGWRAFVAPSAARTDFADWAAVELGAGTTRGAIELAISYRPELLAERGTADDALLHSVIAELRWSASPAVDLAVSALGTRGEDRDLLAAITTLVWRAR